MVTKTARLLGVLAAAAIATVALGVPGCGGGSSANGEPDGSVDGDDVEEAATVIGADSAPLKGCSGYPGQSPASLPGANCCAAGPSHCVPRISLPASLDSAFVGCGDAANSALCVPDPIIQAGSEYVPALCTTKLLTWTLQGVCLSQCITLVSGNSQESR